VIPVNKFDVADETTSFQEVFSPRLLALRVVAHRSSRSFLKPSMQVLKLESK
jgi:hypothetical protein